MAAERKLAKPDLLVRTGLSLNHRKPRQIETEAGIDLVGQRDEPFDEQGADRPRIAQGPRGADGDALDRTVGAEQGKLETPRPVAARGERDLEASGQSFDCREHVLLARNRFVKTALGDIGRDR